MKNNKKTLFILIPLMITIWGGIGYQIYTANETPVAGGIQQFKVKKKLVQENDTSSYALLLNYNDPFKTSTRKKIINTQSTASTRAKTNRNAGKKINEIVNWPALRYGGTVESSNQKKVGLLTINGKSYLVQRGDQIQNVTVLKYDQDEIKLSYSNQEKTIRK